jgi:hypothetical protein
MNAQARHTMKTRILGVTSAAMITLSTLSSVWADPGGGGGGLGGGGASGPEPSQWYFMLTGALILGGIVLYRARAQAKNDA